MKKEATNSFTEGLIMDFNPLATPNNSLVNALNATIITNNGNENTLLNDMGNGRVKTAYLPEGYVPIGTAELGGIIYIVSYNPLKDKCLIGSFPSPERNITQSEVSNSNNVIISNQDFIDSTSNPIIKTSIVKKELSDLILHPGDKFIVYADSLLTNISNISDSIDDTSENKRGALKLKLATVNNNGQLVYLSDLSKYEVTSGEITKTFNIKNGNISSENNTNLDDYRNLVNSTYSIFTSKVTGKLYIVAELEQIELFEINYNSEFKDSKINKYQTTFDINIISKIKLKGLLLKSHNNNSGTETFFTFSQNEEHFENGVFTYKSILPYNIDFVKQLPGLIGMYEFVPFTEYGFLEFNKININIDYSLIGTNTIISDLWRYYKNDNSLIMKFNVNLYLEKNIKADKFDLIFIPYNFNNINFNENDYPIMEISYKKNFSGNYSKEILFSNDSIIEPNSLYLVIFRFKLSSGKFNRLYHILYTNGCFNKEYKNPENVNFDKLKIELKTNLNFIESKNLKSVEENVSNNSLFRNPNDTNTFKDFTNIFTCELFEINQEVNLKENYNTFKIFNGITSGNLSVETSADVKDPILNETNSNTNLNTWVDFKNIKLDDYNSVVNKKDKETCFYGYDLYNNTFKIASNFINEIQASSKLAKIPIKNYFRPILLYFKDFNEQGLAVHDIDLDKNTRKIFPFIVDRGMDLKTEIIENIKLKYPFVNNSRLISLGMSNGGGDNDGSGDVYHINGNINLKPCEFNIEGDAMYLSNIIANTSILKGIPGYSNFPNSDYSKFLTNQTSLSIIPVILTVTGTNKFMYGDGWNKTVKFSLFSGGGVKAKRLDNFKSPQDSKYRIIWLFVKSNNLHINEYIPLNCIFKIYDCDGLFKINPNLGYNFNSFYLKNTENKGFINTDNKFYIANTYPQYIFSLLSLIYICDKTKTITLEKQVPQYIKYYKNILYYINLKFSSTINIENPEYLFNDLKLSDIKLKFENISNSLFNSLNINTYKDNLYEYNKTLNYTVPLNKLDDYFKSSSEFSEIENYVEFNFGTEIISEDKIIYPINPDSKTLYYLPNLFADNQFNSITEVKKIDDDFKVVLLGYPFFKEGKMIHSGFAKLENKPYYIITGNNLKSFIYDPRNKLLLINNSQYNNNNTLLILFGSGNDEGKGTPTTAKDIKLFNNCIITDLNENLDDYQYNGLRNNRETRIFFKK